MKLLLAVLIFVTAQCSANPFADLLKQHNISERCLFEMGYADFPYGHVFDEKSCQGKPPLEKKDYPSGSEEEAKQAYLQWEQDFYNQSDKAWEYLGTTGPYHVIFTHMTRGDSRLDTFLVLKFVDQGLTVRAANNDLFKNELSSVRLEGNALMYKRRITGDTLASSAAEVYRELESEILEDYCFQGLFGTYREHYIGYAELQLPIDEFGLFGREAIISFLPNEGLSPYSGKEYKLAEIKDLVIQMSKDGRAIPNVFQKLDFPL
jgi:hypothetical protein